MINNIHSLLSLSCILLYIVVIYCYIICSSVVYIHGDVHLFLCIHICIYIYIYIYIDYN